MGYVGEDLFANDEDFETAEEWDGSEYDPPAPGDFTLRVDKAEMFVSKKDNKCLRLDYVVAADAGGGSTDQEGKKCTGYYALTQKAKKRLVKVMRAAGVAWVAGQGFDPAEFEGSNIVATIQHEIQKSTTKFDENGQPANFTNVRVINEREANI